MHVSTDDALRRVDARWLGVPGFTFPWRPTRYAAYGVGVPIAIAVIFAVTRLFGSGFWPLVYGLCHRDRAHHLPDADWSMTNARPAPCRR